jgi:small-conductance mechanosensitive channel
MLTQRFVIYWVLLLAQVVAGAFMFRMGVFHMIAASDPTMISFMIFSIHVLSILSIGYLTLRERKGNNSVLWFISEAQLGLGMIGTLVGFVIMFSTVFVGINTPEEIATALGLIASGVGTALWTTLSGLVSSLLIKSSLVNLERKRHV